MIKEIKQITDSKPIIQQKNKLQKQIEELRAKQKKDTEDLPGLNKEIGKIKSKIDVVKKDHSVIDS